MRDIPGYEGLYAATEDGRIWSYRKKGFLKPRKDKDGYLLANLYKDNKMKTYRIHRLIASTYLENPDNLPQVNHIDEDKSNNAVSNLEFCDAAYNINYSKSKKVICIETQEVFDSITKAAKAVDKTPQAIGSCLAGRTKTSAGLHWRYYYEKEEI